MLVFQLNLDHIADRCSNRAGRELSWLLDLVAEINLYLPDDWRMTRSSNNFRIQVVGKHTPALVGHSYRVKGDEILHIIDSVFEKGFFDQYDLSAAAGRSKSRVDAGTKCLHPECIAPNLYFFRPCPDDSPTPLFARQYEKVFKDRHGRMVGTQYHRIHPLTGAGLDLHHHRWVRWDITGHVEPVDTPDPEYHGKDYWDVPLLENDSNRAGYEAYVRNYEKVMREQLLTFPTPPEKQVNAYELEYKFLIEGTEQDAREAFNLIREEVSTGGSFFEETGFRVREESQKRSHEQVDLYLDDDRLTLFGIGASFRIREKRDVIRVTLKKRLPVSRDEAEQVGLYERIEEEAVVTSPQKNALLAGEPINAFPYRLIPYIAPFCDKIKPRLKVINRRQILLLEDSEHRKVELCLDEVTYEPPQGGSALAPQPCFEIEVESKGAPQESLERLARHLEKNLVLKPSPDSKYQRGISLLRK